jgi:flagellar hook-length control protein FliK
MNVTAAPPAPATGVPATGATTGTATDAAADGVAAGFAALLAALAPGQPGPAVPTVPAVVAQAPATPDAEPQAEDGEGEQAAEPAPDGPDAPVATDPALLLGMLTLPAPAAPQVTAPAADGGSDETTAVAAPATPQPQASQPVPETATAPAATAAPSATPDAGPDAAPAADAPAPAVPTTPTTPTTPAGPVAVTAPAAATTDVAPAKAPAPVSRQLFDTIEKLATAGNGTHRVTVRLDPGTLGEVRVHLTVRQGEVHVRLSAGAEARAALSTGAGELQRLLEGAKPSSQVSVDVRNLETAQPVHRTVTEALNATALSTNTDTSAGSATQDQSQPPQGQLGTTTDLLGSRTGSGWTGQQAGSSGAHAGTRRATTARDGDQDGVEGPTSVDPRATGPLRGVDVRM